MFISFQADLSYCVLEKQREQDASAFFKVAKQEDASNLVYWYLRFACVLFNSMTSHRFCLKTLLCVSPQTGNWGGLKLSDSTVRRKNEGC